MPDEPAYRTRVQQVRLTARARPGSFGTAPSAKPGTASDADIRRFVGTMVRIDSVLAAFSGLTFAGSSMADCLPQAVDAFERLMNEQTLDPTRQFSLAAGSSDYRDTGSGGHETSAKVMTTKGDSTTTLALEQAGQKTEVAVNIELGPVAAGAGGGSASS